MNPFRSSREFSLYRQLVFGDRARAVEQQPAPPLPPGDTVARKPVRPAAPAEPSGPADPETA